MTLRDRMARAFGRAPTSTPARANNVGAVAVDIRTPRTLGVTDFAAAAQVIGARSPLARHSVPRGEVFELALGRPLRLYLRALFTVTGTSAADGTITLDLGAAGRTMVRSTRGAPVGAFTTTHPDVTVYSTPTGGGARAVRTVTAVDFDAGEIDLSGLGNAIEHAFEVYYLAGDGDVRLRAQQPAGIDERTVELFNDTLVSLHETEQANGRTAPRISRPGLTALPLGPTWALVLEINSPARFLWTAEAGHELALHGYRVPVAAYDRQALSRLIGDALQSG